jgi:RimJ/RimL family protein N-acetyltransferase
MRCFRVRHFLKADAERIHEFHREFNTVHIWPKTLEDFEELAELECLFGIEDCSTNDIVGVGYVAPGKSPTGDSRWEVGGLFVNEDARRHGLGSALGKVCISNLFAFSTPEKGEKVIAHVHEFNPHPRRMLKNLGFSKVGQETPPPEIVPESMERNKDGLVVGDLFQFDPSKLNDFADWFEGWNETKGVLTGKEGIESKLQIDVAGFKKHFEGMIAALREIAQQKEGE